MKTSVWFQDKLSQFKDDVDFITEEKLIALNEKIVEKMSAKNITRAELAKRLGVSKPMVTKLLNGNANMTIKTMVSVANALDCDINFDIFPKGSIPKTLYLFTNDSYKNFNPILEGEDDACAA
jgi:transcriptional regulator with XRE-family HTH domain